MAERARRRFLAPEVVQTSPMDCGPASLKCLLEGFHVPVAYGRLREACQTDVDGTSIDAITRAARALGLDAAQNLVPVDHVAHEHARTLPAIAVVRLASGANHFVVAWRRVGPLVQVMDPAAGRRWMRVDDLRASLYEHGTTFPSDVWRRFAAAPHALRVLEHGLERIGGARAKELVGSAISDPTWRSLASLDAASRMVRSLVARGAIERGAEAAGLVASLYESARRDDPKSLFAIPPAYWTVRPYAPDADGTVRLFVRGALLVRVRGKLEEGAQDRPPLSHELAAALAEPPARPLRALWREVASDERRFVGALALATSVSAAAVIAQALVFQSFFVLGARFSLDEQRLGVVAALLAFCAGLVLLDLPVADAWMRLGRGLETRWRAAFQAKIPRLPDRWFSSRPSSDMAERANGLGLLRGLPPLFGRALRSLLQIVFTAIGLAWLDPGSLPWILATAAVACLVPVLFQPALRERELSLRNHHGALARFYLEALLGLVAVRVHGAERRLRREHEGMLVEWLRSGRKLAHATTVARAASSLAAIAGAAWLVVDHTRRNPSEPSALLFAYWSLSLPLLGEQLAQVAMQLPGMSNAALRALEPISAPTESFADTGEVESGAQAERTSRASLDPSDPVERIARVETSDVPAPSTADGAREVERDVSGAHDVPAPRASRDARLPHRSRERDDDARIPALAAAPLLKAAGGAGPAAFATRMPASSAAPAEPAGLALDLAHVGLAVGGHPVLEDVDLHVRAGEHVALVGRSGAGKSSLIGLLLGFHRASRGSVRVGGDVLDERVLEGLRRSTAWIDPAAQLWNQSLFDNLVYGRGAVGSDEIAAALDDADLQRLFEDLPQGLSTPLGEGGAFLSGGEGQRVRLARALLRRDVRLALLDEPFRGLDRATRRALLARARERWRGATLVCATHDLEETRDFDRVVVLEHGRVVADGPPGMLARDVSGPYASLLSAERALQEQWNAAAWTRWRVEHGRVSVEQRERTP